MTTRSQYLDKANECADAAKKARDSAERVALLQVSQCFILLSDYVAARQEHGTAIERLKTEPHRLTVSSRDLSGEE
jgi:hypothetical protein